MTDKDEELLGLLKINAREPVAALARKLGVSLTRGESGVRDFLGPLVTSAASWPPPCSLLSFPRSRIS